MDHKKSLQEVYVPKFMRYKFDVEISGRHKRNGVLYPVGQKCGMEYKSENTGLYKNFVKQDYKLHKFTCTRQNCPICFRTHSAIRGKSIASKIWGIQRLDKINLRHWAINYRKKDPPGSFKEIKKLENKFKKILKKYHNERDGELGYTLTIHPYSAMKTCRKCGAEIKGIKNIPRCPECNYYARKGKTFFNCRWVRGWHWHLITNFYTDQFDLLDYELEKIGMQIQNLSKKSKKYPRGENNYPGNA